MVGKERRVRRPRGEQSSPISVPVDGSSFSQIRESTVPLLAQVGAQHPLPHPDKRLTTFYIHSWITNPARRENKRVIYFLWFHVIHPHVK